MNQISEGLKNEAIDRHTETGTIHCIFEISDKEGLNSKEDTRDSKISTILDEGFYVSSWYELMSMPSRKTFYDSVTQHTNIFERHKKVLNFLNSLEFIIPDLLERGLSQEELLWNSYQERNNYMLEVPYISYDSKIHIKVKSNLLIDIIIMNKSSRNVHSFFYNPEQILNIVAENTNIEFKRNIKLNEILK